VRDIISTIDTTGEIVKMKEKHNLMLDQISSLELETVLTMIGLEPAENFVSNLKETLEVDEEKANAIAFDINELIFDKIRKAMMEGDTSEEKGVGDDLDRDSILNEIENPTPTFRPSTIEKKPKIKDNLPEIAPLNVLQKYTKTLSKESFLSQPTQHQRKQKSLSKKSHRKIQWNQRRNPPLIHIRRRYNRNLVSFLRRSPHCHPRECGDPG
jgi:hypothetical protein